MHAFVSSLTAAAGELLLPAENALNTSARHAQGDGRVAVTVGDLLMGQTLPDLRLVFADEHENACGALPDGVAATLELQLESSATEPSPGGQQCLRMECTQVSMEPTCEVGFVLCKNPRYMSFGPH